MYQALYRKWRPQTFSDVVGQPAITDTIKAQVEAGRLSHAYLFSGSRGTGKTTCAKILAKAVNCENPKHGDPCNQCPSCMGITSGSILDVVEIDAASNNGVDGVRELRDEAIYSPATVKKRVYIIDEVHMFSNSAFNALLKILEEPPEHVLFILATTELHKVPATILSRCQRFTFKRISPCDIRDRLLFIARSEHVSIDEDAAEFIARLADGGMRDALSIFDQCASYGNSHISIQSVEDVVGLAGSSAILTVIQAVAKHDTQSALTVLTDIYSNGRDLISVLNELSTYLRDLLICKTAPNANIARLTALYDDKIFSDLLSVFDSQRLIDCIQIIQSSISNINYSANKRIDAELCIIKLCDKTCSSNLSALIDRIDTLERNLQSNNIPKPVKNTLNCPQPVVNSVDSVENSVPLEKKTTMKQTSAPVAENTNILSQWSKITDSAKSDLSPSVIPLICSLQPIIKNNQLILVADNELSHKMLNQRQYIDILHNHTQKILGHNLTIKIVLDKVPVSEENELDSLCTKIKDIPNITIIP